MHARCRPIMHCRHRLMLCMKPKVALHGCLITFSWLWNTHRRRVKAVEGFGKSLCRSACLGICWSTRVLGWFAGRHFAKQEMLLALAILCLRFGIDLDTTKESLPKHDLHGLGFGALSPPKIVPFGIKARSKSLG